MNAFVPEYLSDYEQLHVNNSRRTPLADCFIFAPPDVPDLCLMTVPKTKNGLRGNETIELQMKWNSVTVTEREDGL